MANSDDDGRQPAGLADDPISRIAKFRTARARNPRCDLGEFLPPPGSSHRFTVLVELIKLELDQKAQAGEPTRLEPYLKRYSSDLPVAAVPVSLLFEEYRLRHRYADAPPVSEYRARFPSRYDEFRHYVDRHPIDPSTAGHALGTVLPSMGGPRLASETKAATPLPPPPPPPPPKRPALPPPPTPLIEKEPDYKTIRKIGKGAYGTVFEGRSGGGVPVAIKIISRGIDHPVGQSELKSLEAMKELSHPFLIQIHDFWVDRDELSIVTELAEGSLADWIIEYKNAGVVGVPVEKLVPYFAQVAEALDYLHSKKVSHRDVKPQNLLHLRGYAKVADFGLARTHSHQMTTVAHECGTPNYMAPEVWRKKVDYRSDQYSLAASYVAARLNRELYETEFMDQLIVKHLEEMPKLDPLPRAEQNVLLKALAKKPEDRYPTCVAFTDALREAVLPPAARSSAWTRRAVLAGGGVMAGGLAVLGYLAFSGPDPLPPPPEVFWKPRDWEPAADSTIVADGDGRKFHQIIERQVGDTTVTAVLIPNTRPTDPATYYMLRDKITNRVFAAVWAAMGEREDSALKRFKPEAWKSAGEPLPGRWREGATTLQADAPLLAADKHPDLPVVKLTAVEAALVADELGGRLPRFEHWAKAVELDSGATFDLARAPLRQDAPWPVPRETADVTVHGVRGLRSNGLEWTREAKHRGEELSPFVAPPISDLLVSGASWDAAAPPAINDLKTGRRNLQSWFTTGQQIGFRVVLEPPR